MQGPELLPEHKREQHMCVMVQVRSASGALKSDDNKAPLAGFEPAALGLGIPRSIQLS